VIADIVVKMDNKIPLGKELHMDNINNDAYVNGLFNYHLKINKKLSHNIYG
jgi:hypothetical protein